jgi:hypothetical protein
LVFPTYCFELKKVTKKKKKRKEKRCTISKTGVRHKTISSMGTVPSFIGNKFSTNQPLKAASNLNSEYETKNK